MSRIMPTCTTLTCNRCHLPLQQRPQPLPPLPPALHLILPIPNLRPQIRLMPFSQTLKARHLAQLQHPNAIIRQRPLQSYLFQTSLRICQDTQDLAVYFEAVEQVREVGEVGGRCVLAVDVEPDEAFGCDCATEYFGEIEGVDVGEAGADEGDGGVVVCSEEGAAVGVDGGYVDWREGFVGFGVGYGWVERHK